MVRITTPLMIALATLVSVASATPRVDPGVHRTLRQQGSVNLIVTMKDSPMHTLQSVEEAAFTSRSAMIENLVDKLEAKAKESQAEVDALLFQEAFGSEFTSAKSLWISNQIFIEGANANLVSKLGNLPSVFEVREEKVLPLPAPLAATNEIPDANTTANAQWGVAKIKATDAWAKGFNGEGIVVGMIDTGARGTHEAIKGNYRGAYGWFDPERNAAEPYDGHGHGSHVMGTIAGANGIGVAPGATWMACKGCRSSGCPESDLLRCGQFMMCPTDTKGENKDCSKAPRLVSNSWGGGQNDDFYKTVIDGWQKAGIIPVFANGNEGPSCSTASSPGDYHNVIGVGATDSSDGLARFSSKGPSKSGLLKPDVSAPGHNIHSAWHDSDTSYNSISGTSMATPHVAGAIAVVLQAKPDLTYEDVKTLLTSTADKNTLKPAGKTCGSTNDGSFPNNNYGHGRINLLTAISGPDATPTPTLTPAPTSLWPTSTPTGSPSPTSEPPAPKKCDAYTNQHDCNMDFDCIWDEDTNTCHNW